MLFYDASLNRFLQPDTIVPGAGNPQNWNRYSYVGNNPISRSDPSGHMMDDGNHSGGGAVTNCKILGTCPQPPTIPPAEGGDDGDWYSLPPIDIVTTPPSDDPQDDAGVPKINNARGSMAVGGTVAVDLAWDFYDAFALPYAPPPTATLRFTLYYHEQANGWIDELVLAVDNTNGGTNVFMRGVEVKTKNILLGTASLSGHYNLNKVGPERGRFDTFCGNCIGDNTYSLSNLPIDNNSQTTFTFSFFTDIAGEFTRLTPKFEISPYFIRR